MPNWFEERDDCIIVRVRIIPRAAEDSIVGVLDSQTLKIRIHAPPVEGKANACLVRFLSRKWRIPRADIHILSGETGRSKRLRIAGPSPELRKELLSIQPC